MDNLIFMSGGITGLSVEESTTWRAELTEMVNALNMDWHTWDPTIFGLSEYNAMHYGDKFESIAMKIDLDNLRRSNAVICNMNCTTSIGTSMELMLAKELNIPIIGFCDENNRKNIHPWWQEVSVTIENTMEEGLLFLVTHYA